MLLNGWDLISGDDNISLMKNNFTIRVVLIGGNNRVSVYHNEKMCDKIFCDLTTAVIWCEGRM